MIKQTPMWPLPSLDKGLSPMAGTPSAYSYLSPSHLPSSIMGNTILIFMLLLSFCSVQPRISKQVILSSACLLTVYKWNYTEYSLL
jgi:hypothetical protein